MPELCRTELAAMGKPLPSRPQFPFCRIGKILLGMPASPGICEIMSVVGVLPDRTACSSPSARVIGEAQAPKNRAYTLSW